MNSFKRTAPLRLLTLIAISALLMAPASQVAARPAPAPTTSSQAEGAQISPTRPWTPAEMAAARPLPAVRPAEPAAPAAVAEDPRLTAIREQLATLAPADQAGLMALAKAVADAAGAECVLYNVMRDDVMETAVGWRLPPS